MEVGPHVQTGAQQVHGREGAGHGAQVVVQVAVRVVTGEGKSGNNMEKYEVILNSERNLKADEAPFLS